MSLFEDIVKEILMESADVSSVNDAIDGKYCVNIKYRGEKGEHTGPRIIQPVAYGTTKAGFPVVRAFQPQGDTSSRVPSWKFFRLDRIESWEPMPNDVFDEPPGFNQALGKFNPNGDESMSQVFKIADFGGGTDVKDQATQASRGPLMKADVIRGFQKPSLNTTPNPIPGERPVQKQFTTEPITKNDVRSVNGEFNAIDRLKQKLSDENYVSQAVRDAANINDMENNEGEENTENQNG